MGIKSLMVVLLASFTAFSASAETEIACWNIFAKKGSFPILRARIVRGDVLNSVTFNLKDEYFTTYFVNKTEDAGEQWGHKQAISQSALVNPVGNIQAQLIATNRSPYRGDNEFDFVFGEWSHKAPYGNQQGTYPARLILPRDLSNNFLQSFRIRTASERSNAVLVLAPAREADQGGDNFLRMFCMSR